MAQSEQQKEVNKIKKKIIKSMESIGVYRPEYDPTIVSYATLRWQYEKLQKEFIETGMKYTEEFTNKNGSTNDRKAIVYQIMEGMRKDILTYENTLGLTPISVKKIKQKSVGMKTGSAFEEILKNV